MIINRYRLVDRNDRELDTLYDDAQEAIADAGEDYAVIELSFEYADSELIYTPDGRDTWPPQRGKGGRDDS